MPLPGSALDAIGVNQFPISTPISQYFVLELFFPVDSLVCKSARKLSPYNPS
jgi:hypothetical protein